MHNIWPQPQSQSPQLPHPDITKTKAPLTLIVTTAARVTVTTAATPGYYKTKAPLTLIVP